LAIFDLPRLSVAIELDFTENLQKDEMLAERKKATGHIAKFMESSGYAYSSKSKTITHWIRLSMNTKMPVA
jgi:hypothetical protein